MTTAKIKPLPDPALPWSDTATGRPTPPFAEYMQGVARALVLLNVGTVGPLVDAANDAAAAAAGVPINGLYANSGAVRIRLV
jgi:hypothetical protein